MLIDVSNHFHTPWCLDTYYQSSYMNNLQLNFNDSYTDGLFTVVQISDPYVYDGLGRFVLVHHQKV